MKKRACLAKDEPFDFLFLPEFFLDLFSEDTFHPNAKFKRLAICSSRQNHDHALNLSTTTKR